MTLTAWSLLIALCWILPFAVGRHVRMTSTVGRRAWLSAAGGSAIAYVFVDLLPEMQRMQGRFIAAATGRPFPFPHYRVYLAALIGFLMFYALEHLVVTHRHVGRDSRPRGWALVFWVQVAGFALYTGLMAYLLREDADSRALALVPYGLAMFCHFWIVDAALRREHGVLYDRAGSWIVALGIPAGWIAAQIRLSSDLVVPTLMGVIAGGVVLNSIKGELPEEGEGRPGPFLAAAVGYALLLLAAG